MQPNSFMNNKLEEWYFLNWLVIKVFIQTAKLGDFLSKTGSVAGQISTTCVQISPNSERQIVVLFSSIQYLHVISLLLTNGSLLTCVM